MYVCVCIYIIIRFGFCFCLCRWVLWKLLKICYSRNFSTKVKLSTKLETAAQFLVTIMSPVLLICNSLSFQLRLYFRQNWKQPLSFLIPITSHYVTSTAYFLVVSTFVITLVCTIIIFAIHSCAFWELCYDFISNFI